MKMRVLLCTAAALALGACAETATGPTVAAGPVYDGGMTLGGGLNSTGGECDLDRGGMTLGGGLRSECEEELP